MALGQNSLARGARGAEVEELQLLLAGFHGSIWDGDFGPGTERQVMAFQREYMGMAAPAGKVEKDTFEALRRFIREYPLDFGRVKCPCGRCNGFGNGQYKGEYRAGKPHVEAYHNYEYPGIHKAILNSFRAALFFAVKAGHPAPYLTSGYRCWINNRRKGRRSTNHMGKALDCDFHLKPGEDKRDDAYRCDKVRGVLVENSGFQIGWSAGNKKALEPSNIAPTWIHMDVRNYATKYLDERFFVTTSAELDAWAGESGAAASGVSSGVSSAASTPSHPPKEESPVKNTFSTALKHVLVHEGGYVDHPKDPGGATMKGVTLATYRRHFGVGKTKNDLRNISEAELEQIYRSGYWDKCKCDELPDGLDYAVFDAAVNSGPGRSAKWLQGAVGAKQDGGIGPKTVAKVREREPAQVIHDMCDERLDFLQRLSTWSTFGRGWGRRVEGVRETAVEMAGGHVPAVDFETTRKGDNGYWVQQLQQALGIHVDGDFGPGTESALKDWQREQGLEPDGIAGRNTYRALGLIG